MNCRLEQYPRNKVPKVVLILQSDKAYWYKLVGDKPVDRFQEYILGDCVDRQIHCPWITSTGSSAPVQVELILDTTLDEVDRVGLKVSQSTMIDKYRKLMTLARLRRDYQQSNVYALPSDDSDTMAALMHPAIPEFWASWLIMLQSADLVFHRVVTGSELAVRWSRHLPNPTLLVMQVANFERHLLVSRGVVHFLRTVALPDGRQAHNDNDEFSALSPIEQSKQYLHSAVALDVSAIGTIHPCFNFESYLMGSTESGGITGRAGNGVTGSSENLVTHSVDRQISVLLAMLLELDMGLNHRDQAAGLGAQDKNVSRVGSDSRGGHRISGRLSGFCNNFWDRCALPVRKRQSTDQWSIRRSALRQHRAFESSLRYANTSHRLARVYQTSLVFAIVAAFSASSAVYDGLVSKRLIRQYDVQKASMVTSESTIEATARAAFSQPRIAAESLFIADELLSPAWLEPEDLLAAVATVVTDMPGVQLDRLVWMLAERDEPYESINHALDAVSYRQSVTQTTRDISIQLELSGRVFGETLNAQQQLLLRFLDKLQHLPGTVDAHVLESPLDTALSSRMGSDDGHGRYRVAMILGKQQ
ncbi:MAG: hypothetical protein AB8B97_16560 [Granulosicoccus sp.]